MAKGSDTSSYLLPFSFAWGSLARSIYFGTRVHQAYLAYLLVPSTTVEGATKALNDDLGKSIWWMFGDCSFVSWLLFYLGWSVMSKDVPNVRGDSVIADG